jgi:pimeloyl-ACP methyl ester carboxylesterase
MSIRPRALLRALVALATVGLASSALAATAGAGTASSKPTIVLVHGAFADSSGFTGVIDQLRRDGYPVRATPNRLLGLQSDAATVRGFLDSFKGPKILAGHSYGGAVITQAASGDSDVKALVYVAAFALDSNEVLGDLANRPVAHPLAPLPTVPVQSKQPDGTTGTDLYLDPSHFRARFAGDLPRRVAADLAATQPPTRPRPSQASSPSNRRGRRSPVGISSPSRTTPSRPTSSASWHASSTRTGARSTARTPSTSVTPRQSPASPSKRRARPAEPRRSAARARREQPIVRDIGSTQRGRGRPEFGIGHDGLLTIPSNPSATATRARTRPTTSVTASSTAGIPWLDPTMANSSSVSSPHCCFVADAAARSRLLVRTTSGAVRNVRPEPCFAGEEREHRSALPLVLVAEVRA